MPCFVLKKEECKNSENMLGHVHMGRRDKQHGKGSSTEAIFARLSLGPKLCSENSSC